MRFPEEREVFHYSLVCVMMHDRDKTSSGTYYCYILDLNTRVWKLCDEKNVTELTGLPDSLYCVS